MKKIALAWIALLAVLGCLTLEGQMASPVDINGHFLQPNAEGIPAKWTRNTWSGYQPACKLETRVGGSPDRRSNSLRMFDVPAERGAAFNSNFYPARQGQTLHFSFHARGIGQCQIKLFFKTVSNEWNFESDEKVNFNVTDDWQWYQFDIPIKDGRAGVTGSFDISVQISQGGELEVADFDAVLLPTPVKLKVTSMDFIEDFDDAELTVTGNPELIRDYPTQGLLVLTGQAVYRTDGDFWIQPLENHPYPAATAADAYRAVGLRIQNFGREGTAPASSQFIFELSEGRALLQANVQQVKGEDQLRLVVSENGRMLVQSTMHRRSLPADFLFGVTPAGEFTFQAKSLVDGSVSAVSGKSQFRRHKEVIARVMFSTPERDAEAVVDNFLICEAVPADKDTTPPFIIHPDLAFDPVKAGWPLVWADEFDGDALDETKWSHNWHSYPEKVLVHDGLLEIVADWNDDHTAIHTGALSARENFQYGYFEGRFKFRQQPGWWSAFWLYGATNDNPFYDGFEIDIYEDYFLTELTPGTPARNILDHNLHVYSGQSLKSWNYNGPKLGSLEPFHVIGCKWTPFEISYYMDGKLIGSSANHSPYKNVIFDAFRHACGLAPIHPMITGEPKKSAGDPNRGVYPESFFCDYVRVYAFPQEDIPQVQWSATPRNPIANYGDVLQFSAEAMPNASTGSPIRHAYLFDSGYLIAHKSDPPFDFKVILNQEFYNTTDYTRPGRQGVVPKFEQNFHCYSIFVQDEAGKVAHTPVWILAYIKSPGNAISTPFHDTPQTIPGRISLTCYDEGGQGLAYMDVSPGNSFAGRPNVSMRQDDVDATTDTIGYVMSGEWLNYTVNIAEGGTYRATLHYGYPFAFKGMVKLYLDDQQEVASFDIVNDKTRSHEINKTATATVRLPAGQHLLKMLFLAKPNVNFIDFELLKN
ncbi:MAG: family 16 glycosylhydrolase [Victivallales bacterium]|nr:family 16 glycosylhydrolase [Victivallales bacterium]